MPIDPASTVHQARRASMVRNVTLLHGGLRPGHGLAKVAPDGLVRREDFGETTILVRYLHRQEPVRLAFVPARRIQMEENAGQQLHRRAGLARLLTRMPSELCGDDVFVRRAYLDLLGILPTAEEARSSCRIDAAINGRVSSINRSPPEFADFWALKWSDLLRVEERTLDQRGCRIFTVGPESIARNKPLINSPAKYWPGTLT
jgi:hypothetical protein